MTLPHHPMVTLNVLKPASVRSFEMQTYLSTEIDNKNGIICIPGNTQRAIPDTEQLTFSTFFALLWNVADHQMPSSKWASWSSMFYILVSMAHNSALSHLLLKSSNSNEIATWTLPIQTSWIWCGGVFECYTVLNSNGFADINFKPNDCSDHLMWEFWFPFDRNIPRNIHRLFNLTNEWEWQRYHILSSIISWKMPGKSVHCSESQLLFALTHRFSSRHKCADRVV